MLESVNDKGTTPRKKQVSNSAKAGQKNIMTQKREVKSSSTCQVRALPCAASVARHELKQVKQIAYTIATLMNDRTQYDAMVESFTQSGFDCDDCEFLIIDNTGKKQTNAYKGLNQALNSAKGRYVVLCHQDIRLLKDGRKQLDACLANLDALDQNWAVASNAGGIGIGKLAIRISDPHGDDQKLGDLPARVASVDENFIVVKRESRVGFSNDLNGFHLYGADLCLNADVMGWNAYVIDFHLAHLSAGNKDASFTSMENAFRSKWDRALRSRFIPTTCTLLRIGGDPNKKFFRRGAEIIMKKAVRFGVHLKACRHWLLSKLRARDLFWSFGQRGHRDA